MNCLPTVPIVTLVFLFLHSRTIAQPLDSEQLRVEQGYSLLINPIDFSGTIRLPTVYNIFGRPPEGTVVFLFDADRQSYTFNQFQKGVWLDPRQIWPAGTGALIYNPTNAFSVPFDGLDRYKPAPPSTVHGLNLLDPAALLTFLAFKENDALIRLENQFVPYLFLFGQWSPSLPSFGTNEAVFYRTSSGPQPGNQRNGGTLLFCNYVPALGLDARALFFDGKPISGASDAFVQLWAGPLEGPLEPIGSPVRLLDGDLAGYFNGGIISIPSVPAGGKAYVEFRIATGGGFGLSGSGASVVLGGGFLPPGVPIGLNFNIGTIGSAPIFSLSRGISVPPPGDQNGGTVGDFANPFALKTLCGRTVSSVTYYFLSSPNDSVAWVSTAGSSFDSIMSVFKVNGGLTTNAIQEVACNDDRRSDDKTSEVAFAAESGRIYLVAVGAATPLPFQSGGIKFAYGFRESQTFSDNIPVPNGSFESPATTFDNEKIDFWARSPKPDFWTEGPWEPVFDVSSYIGAFDNVDGKQIAEVFSQPTAALFQDYDSTDLSGITHSLNSTFEVNKAYHLTVALYSDDLLFFRTQPLRFGLYYRDNSGQRTPIASVTVTNDDVTFPTPDHFVDFDLALPPVQATDAWAGRHIGIEFVCTTDFDKRGNAWYIDNVRLRSESPIKFDYVRLPGRLRINAPARVGYDYRLESSKDLQQWQDVGPVSIVPASGQISQEISVKSDPSQFYRIAATRKL